MRKLFHLNIKTKYFIAGCNLLVMSFVSDVLMMFVVNLK